jgi:hypothetical protein
VELQELYADEELFLVQRCSERWLLKGDHNPSYFHRVANGRKGKKSILMLKDGEVNIKGTANLLKYATEFYKKLFGLAPGNLI